VWVLGLGAGPPPPNPQSPIPNKHIIKIIKIILIKRLIIYK